MCLVISYSLLFPITYHSLLILFCVSSSSSLLDVGLDPCLCCLNCSSFRLLCVVCFSLLVCYIVCVPVFAIQSCARCFLGHCYVNLVGSTSLL